MTSAGVVTVIKAYRCAYPDPLKVKRGEIVSTQHKDCEWPGWVWCRSSRGVEGWLPEAFLVPQPNANRAALSRDVDATELTVEVGDVLTFLEEVAGWIHCRTQDGSVGWIPADNVVK